MMVSIVDSGPRVVELTPGAGLSAQKLHDELVLCHAQLADCRAVLTIPPILIEVARLIAAEPPGDWMGHVATVLMALEGMAEDGAAFVVALYRLVQVLNARTQNGAWEVVHGN
jgi:hypothetical protein